MNSYLNNTFIMPGAKLITVKGYQQAKDYPVPADSTVAIFDADEDIVYIKTCDINNFASTRRFKLEEVPDEQPVQNGFVTTDEFSAFKEEILNGQHSIQSALEKLTAATTVPAADDVIDAEYTDVTAGKGTKKRSSSSSRSK